MSRQFNKRSKFNETPSKTVVEKRRKTKDKQDVNLTQDNPENETKTDEDNAVAGNNNDVVEEQLKAVLASVRNINTNESKFQFLHSVFNFLTTCPAKQFYNEVIRSEIEESSRFNEVMLGALFKAIEQSVQESKYRIINGAPKEFKQPVTYFDFTMCEDEQFQEMMHVSRKTAKIIIEHIRHIPVDLNSESYERGLTQNSEPLDKILFLVLWYLRSNDSNLEHAVSLFELGTIENAKKLLNRGFSLLLNLKADAGLLWPTDDEFLIAAALIERRFSFPNVAGLVGHRVVKCVNGQRLMLQAVCNEKGMFTDVFISFDTRPRVVFKQSLLKNKIKEMKNGLSFICEDFGVPEKCTKSLLFPEREDPDEPDAEVKVFNYMHDFVISLLKNSFQLLFKRFQKLELLDNCEPDIVKVACVLHNYCIKFSDLTPL